MSWLSDLGNFISSIPVVGNITDFIDDTVYDVLDVGGQALGLNKSDNLFGMNSQEFADRILHPIGIAAAATYGVRSALSAPAAVGEGAAAGMAGAEGATAGLTAADVGATAAGTVGTTGTAAATGATAADVATAGSMLEGAATAAPVIEGSTDLGAILADMEATAAANNAIAAGTGAAGGAAAAVPEGFTNADLALSADQAATLNANTSPSAWYDPSTGAVANASINPQPWYSQVGDVVSKGVNSVIPDSTLGKMMLTGALLNTAGNYMGANQMNQNLDQFRADAAWTPERTEALTKGISTNVGNVYGNLRKKNQNTIASKMAELGKSGGTAGRMKFQMEEANREAQAQAITDALVKAGVYTPPGQLTGAGAYNKQNPWAASVTGASGVVGNYANALMTIEALKRLYPSLAT